MENELITLINYVKTNPNKMLLMNSRVTIYNEAKDRSQQFKKLTKKTSTFEEFIVDFTYLTRKDKANILYNHLYYNQVPREYFNVIRQDQNYKKIIDHPNYSPRIIEYLADKSKFEKNGVDSYNKFILNKLDFSHDIWGNEFYRRLENVDRIFMLILYSLTDTTVRYDILEKSFNKRISEIYSIDTSINQFEECIQRMNGAMITILDIRGTKEVGVLNPSI